MAENPLAGLIAHGASSLDANHKAFKFDASSGEHGISRAHIARANPICQEIERGSDVLVISQGATGYISPIFYPNKQETHWQVAIYKCSCPRMAGLRSATIRSRAASLR